MKENLGDMLPRFSIDAPTTLTTNIVAPFDRASFWIRHFEPPSRFEVLRDHRFLQDAMVPLIIARCWGVHYG